MDKITLINELKYAFLTDAELNGVITHTNQEILAEF